MKRKRNLFYPHFLRNQTEYKQKKKKKPKEQEMQTSKLVGSEPSRISGGGSRASGDSRTSGVA